MKAFFEKIGSNFFVAAFVPSLGFLIISTLIFDPIIPPNLSQQLEGTFEPLNQAGVLLIISAMLLGFTLASLKEYHYRLFQGYYFPFNLPLFHKHHIRKAEVLKDKLSDLDEKIDNVSRSLKNISLEDMRDEYERLTTKLNLYDTIHSASCRLLPFNLPLLHKWHRRTTTLLEEKRAEIKLSIKGVVQKSRKLEEMRDEYYHLSTQYQRNYPEKTEDILPTRFGNIVSAAEHYIANRYGINDAAIWHRLSGMIPENYNNMIERADNSLSFLINCAILSITMAILCVLAAFYQILMLGFAQNNRPRLLYFVPVQVCSEHEYYQRIWLYLAGSVIAIAVTAIICYISTQVATAYATMKCSAYDLFRFELLSRMKLEMPTDSYCEYDQWQKISEFIDIGEAFGPLTFDYNMSNKDVSS
jgi:hypothetical protein